MPLPRSGGVRFAACVTIGGLLAAACGGGGDDDAETTTTQPATTTTEIATTTVAPTTAPPTTAAPTTTLPSLDGPQLPLTGQRVDESSEVLGRPALAVKIDNNPRAQSQQSGLAVADIVFEEIVENQDTRFAAVFHSRDSDPVGPIRSGRSQDVPLLLPFNEPLFAWSGGNAGVTQFVRDSALTDLNAIRNATSYFRGPGQAPHNLFSTTDDLYALTPDDHPGPPSPYFVYLLPDDEFEGDTDADLVELQMRSVPIAWRWDDEVGRYERSQEGGLHVDATHGQIYADNVVVLAVNYGQSVFDPRSPEAQTVGTGGAYVFSNGQAVYGEWGRFTPESPIVLFDAEGRRLALTPGTTWIELAEAVNGAPDDEWPLELTVTPG